MLKDDLVDALFKHLEDNEPTYAKQSAFADFYGRSTRGASPIKRERSSPSENFTALLPSKTRRRTLVKAAES